MISQGRAFLPLSVADEWVEEWRRANGFSSMDASTKLDPVEELVGASVLMRPAEVGFGAARNVIGYQFTLQKLAERVILRGLLRRIAPKKFPNIEVMLEWAALAAPRAEGAEPFIELVNVLRKLTKLIIYAGDIQSIGGLINITNIGVCHDVMDELLGALAVVYYKNNGRAIAVATAIERALMTAPVHVFNIISPCCFDRLKDHNPNTAKAFVADMLFSAVVKQSQTYPDNQEVIIGFARMAQLTGLVHEELGNIDISIERYWQAISACGNLTDIDKYIWFIAWAGTGISRLLRRKGNATLIISYYEKIVNSYEKLSRKCSENRELLCRFSKWREYYGDALLDHGLTDTAIAQYDAAGSLVDSIINLPDVDLPDPGPDKFEELDEYGTGERELEYINLWRKISNAKEKIGDKVGALSELRKGLAILNRFAAQDPIGIDWQRELVVSHNKIGDILLKMGELDAALDDSTAYIAATERLAALDPSNRDWQQYLAVSHKHMGRVLKEQGDSLRALEYYRNALAIEEALIAQDPTNTDWQEGLTLTRDRIEGLVKALADAGNAGRTIPE